MSPVSIGVQYLSSPEKPQNPRNANELPWSKPYAFTSGRMTAKTTAPTSNAYKEHRNKQKPKQDDQHNGTTMSPSKDFVYD